MLPEHEGQAPQIHSTARVAPNATLCGNVVIGPNCSIGFGAVLVGGGVDQQAELIGARLGAGRAVRSEMQLMGLDQILRLASRAIDLLVTRSRAGTGPSAVPTGAASGRQRSIP
jgi:hypothetical protein